jgi:hypothetical protein
VIGSSAAIWLVLPCGRSRGGELGEEGGLTVGPSHQRLRCAHGNELASLVGVGRGSVQSWASA